jgi:hypothetical protein
MSRVLAGLGRRGQDEHESLILAQNERWRHASYMQVERKASALSGARVSNAWEPTILWGIHEGNFG